MRSVLLVEDDQFIIDIYATKLKEAGFRVRIAQNGEEAIEKIEEERPDLMILDIVLPAANGWEILRRIKQNPKFEKLKIIILSNLSQKDEIEKGISLGAVNYFIKAHYTPSEIVKEIKKILK